MTFNTLRFHHAQQHAYSTALSELRSGRKRSHWIWYIFPQLKGLGRSLTAEQFGLDGLAEARAYLADPLLRQRLVEATEAMLAHQSLSAASVLGELDALKFRSCLTLFALADPSEPVFTQALDHFFDGEQDPRTLALLELYTTGVADS